MAQMETLRDCLMEELRDIYSAENQLVKALPKMEQGASNPRLKEALRMHLDETHHHVGRLDQIASLLDEKLSGKTCKGMKGLIEEGSEVLSEQSENDALRDALIIGAAQRVEHYEMAAYGTARAMAEELGEDQVAEILQETLQEESATDQKLTEISESEVLSDALSDEEEDEQAESSGRGARSPDRM